MPSLFSRLLGWALRFDSPIKNITKPISLATIFDYQYKGKISAEQGYRLRQLLEEGYDVSVGLEGKITGFLRCNEMLRRIEANDEDGVRKLIKETEVEEKERDLEIKRHLQAIRWRL